MVRAENNMETERATPLLQNYTNHKSRSDGNYASMEENQTHLLGSTPRNSRAIAFIYGFQCLENTGYNGVAVNLAIYLSSVLNESNATTVANVSFWGGTSYFTPLIGAFLADTYLGNYKTVLFSGLLYFPGMVMVTISAISSSIRPVSGVHKLLFFCGLYLVAAGSGGVKAALVPHAMEQFDVDESPVETQRKAEFFNRFYVCLVLGVLVSGTFIVWIQVNVSWALGFGLSTMCVVLALLLFITGTPTYRMGKPSGSPLKRLLQVMAASVKKMNVEPPEDDKLLYEVNENEELSRKHKLAHTKEFKFLDKAATLTSSDLLSNRPHSAWNLCCVTQVEELKVLLRLVPIWTSGIIFNACYSQIFTTFIEQGRAMNTTVLSFSIPPASLTSLEVIFVMVWAFTSHHFNSGIGLSQLQRIGLGRLLMILTMASAAIVEAERLYRLKLEEEISIAWQIPYYFLLGGSEMFCNIGHLEFFYEEAPESMKSLCIAFTLLCISLGSYLNSLLVLVVELLTTRGGRKGWLPDDLNDGHLDYFFWGLTALACFDFTVFVVLAQKYTPKKVVLE